ncbi:discoidin domain-containing protein [Pseudomonas sp. Au-Pse12]|uniref:discoidin domain-containing protein n=1 Tax=Pseudomonas sp. Au-Pse12 TaxID=2906459 RepID=UPI001E5B85B5|nr:discoidin domain-containing protein [Pseudomonas sp. Au-Pse12]MCE4056644.1 discoidin domain-containing protein [Pseudomonas sp. Au-Pse12]
MPTFRLNALSRATRLWVASLGTAFMLPLSGLALASEAPSRVAQAPMESVLSGHFINLQALTANPMQRSTVEVGTDLLLQETGMRIRSLVPQHQDTFKDINVMTGQLEGRARSLNAPGEMVLAARPDGSFIALLPDANVMIRGNAQGEQSLIRIGTSPTHAPESLDYLIDESSGVPGQQESRSGQRSFQANRNAEGEIVIDLLAGFSQKAADYIGDHEAYAMIQVTLVNRALQQSKVQGVRLRLVGTQVIANDYPITGETLRQVSTLFADGMRRYSPDVVAGFIMGTPGVDTAVGWGYVNGRYSINYINSVTTFRHELGHNIGGSHCSDGSSYRFGYNNGRVGTILCGDQVNYYSNPDVNDRLGIPLGNAATADMARVWRENAARMSAYSPSVVAIGEEQATSILDQKVSLEKNQTRYYPVDVPEGTQRLVFSALDGQLSEKSGKVQLLLKHSTQPTPSSYDYRSIRNHAVSLGVNNPLPGRWYLAINTDNKATQDLSLEGHAYNVTQDTAQGRYLKLLATSAVDGKDSASIAELQLVDAKGKPLPRDSWKVHSTSSAVAGSEAHVIDGNPSSYWSSATGARYPHEIVLNLGADSRFSQLHYLPRQDAGMSGNIKGYQVYGSNSPSGAWTLLADGEFSADNQVKSTALKPLETVKPPIAVISGKTEANAGDLIVLDASTSSDPQGHALSFAWQASPTLDFDFDGARISFTAPELQEDTRYDFTLTLSNGKQSSSRTHTVLIKGKAATSSCKPQWTVRGTYVGNDVVQWKGRQYQARWWTSGAEPGLASTTGADGAGKVWRDLGPCQNGDDESTKPPVEEVKPPVAIIGGATQAKGGESVTLDAAGSSDPAGLALSYSWSVTPSVAFQASGSKLTFVAPKSNKDISYRFTLALSNGSHTVKRDHSVTVQADNVETPSGCQGAWSPQGTYVANDKVSHKGRFYVARWWTKGNEPSATTVGGEGSGKVWRDAGACN